MGPAGLGPENVCAGKSQQQLYTTEPILSSKRMLHNDYERKCSVEKKATGRESQGSCSQDELIGGKPPVVK
jgi:hypothetical protein